MPRLTGNIGRTGPVAKVMVRRRGRDDHHQFEALFDTGATDSMIDPVVTAAVRPLRLRSAPLSGVVGGSHRCPIYLVEIGLFNNLAEMYWSGVEVGESDFRIAGYEVIIGLDILKFCVLTCNGPAGTFTLDYPDQP